MADIFISYSKRDPQLTINLAKDLEARGYTTWWDTSLLPGDEFPEKIRQELNKAKAVIVIWTPASIASSWVQAEAFIANNQNKLITLRSSDLDPRSIPLPYNIRHAALVTDYEAIYAALNQNEALTPYGDGLSAELIGLRQDSDDAIRYANNITGYIYGGEKNVPRFDIVEINTRYHIAWNGDTTVNAIFEIHCTTESAHFWKYWIYADAESDAVTFFRRLKFEVVDMETSQKLDWLPTLSDTRHKIFAIFFPEVKPGERKRLRISYFWPGYMKKLTDLGATGFDWSYRSQHPEIRARFRKEWIFEPGARTVRCRQTGRQSKSALLRFAEQKGRSIWIYEDSSATLDGTKYAVEFSLS